MFTACWNAGSVSGANPCDCDRFMFGCEKLIFSPALFVSCSGLIRPPPSMNPPPGAGSPARLPGGSGRIRCSGTRPPPLPPAAPGAPVAGEDGDSEEGGVDPELSLPEPGRLSLLNALEVVPDVVGCEGGVALEDMAAISCELVDFLDELHMTLVFEASLPLG